MKITSETLSSIITDSISDVFSEEAFKYFEDLFKPYLKDLSKSQEIQDRVLTNIITSTQMTLSIYASYLIQEFLERAFKRIAGSFVLINGMKSLEKLKGKKITRFLAKRVSGFIGNNRQTNTMLVQSALRSADNLDTIIQQERHNATTQKYTHQKLSFENYKHKENGNYLLFSHYLTTGSWKNTKEHERLFSSIIGYKVAFDTQFVEKLNGFSQYATTTTGKVLNLSESILKMSTVVGAKQ